MNTTTEQQPAPDYGEPWHEQEPPHPISVRAGVYWLNPRQFNRAVACVNACAGMADPAKEISELKAYAQKCKDGCITLSHSIDRIDYACGEPNEMEVSDYCIHQCDEAVVERVKAKMAEIQAMREAIKEAYEVILLSPYPDQEALAKLKPFLP